MKIDENITYFPIKDIVIKAFEEKFGNQIQMFANVFAEAIDYFSKCLADTIDSFLRFVDTADFSDFLKSRAKINKIKQIPVKKIKPTVFAPKQRILPYARNRL